MPRTQSRSDAEVSVNHEVQYKLMFSKSFHKQLALMTHGNVYHSSIIRQIIINDNQNNNNGGDDDNRFFIAPILKSSKHLEKHNMWLGGGGRGHNKVKTFTEKLSGSNIKKIISSEKRCHKDAEVSVIAKYNKESNALRISILKIQKAW